MLPERYGGVRRAVSPGTTRHEAAYLRHSHHLGHRRRRRVLLPRLRRRPQLPPSHRPSALHRARRAAAARAAPAGPVVECAACRDALRHRRARPPHHHPVLRDAPRRRPHRRPRRPRRRRHHLPYGPGDRGRHRPRGRVRRLHGGAALRASSRRSPPTPARLRSSTPRPRRAAPPSPSSSTRRWNRSPRIWRPPGRESILLQGARIALADGPYSPAEREVLTTVGRRLQLCADDTARLLAAARTPL